MTFTHKSRSHSHKLIPEQLFGIRYGDKKLCFLLETDRATELASHGSFERNSFLRTFLQYRQFVGGQLYKKHYGMEEGMVVLFLTTTERDAEYDRLRHVRHEGRGNNLSSSKVLTSFVAEVQFRHHLYWIYS